MQKKASDLCTYIVLGMYKRGFKVDPKCLLISGSSVDLYVESNAVMWILDPYEQVIPGSIAEGLGSVNCGVFFSRKKIRTQFLGKSDLVSYDI